MRELTEAERSRLRKEIWDVGQVPFLLYAAAKVPRSSVRLIDGATLKSIGGYVPDDWDGTSYDVLDRNEANKMQRSHPAEFAKYAPRKPADDTGEASVD